MALYDDDWQAQLERSVNAQPGVFEGRELAASGQNIAGGEGDFFDYFNVLAAPLAFTGFGLGKASGITPAGLKGLAQAKAMIRRSNQPFTTPVPTAARNQTHAQRLEGPGTYFSNRPASRDRWWYMGDNVQRLQIPPRGALQIARGRGFMDEAELARRMAANPGDAGATGLADLQVNSPLVKQIMDEGYIGLSSNAGRTAGRRPFTIGNEVQTVFDPASIPGVKFKNLGKIDNTTGLWENPNSAQAVENFVRNLSTKSAGMHHTATQYMPVSEILGVTGRLAMNRVLSKLRLNKKPRLNKNSLLPENDL